MCRLYVQPGGSTAIRVTPGAPSTELDPHQAHDARQRLLHHRAVRVSHDHVTGPFVAAALALAAPRTYAAPTAKRRSGARKPWPETSAAQAA
jgi:hypothetical protein